MGEAKRRGTFQQRKAEAEFYANERNRYEKWLKDHRPRVTYKNSMGGKQSYLSMLTMAALSAWTSNYHLDVEITN
jgi:hypothetical protein